jgi:predicted O-methyltransferase YrrM
MEIRFLSANGQSAQTNSALFSGRLRHPLFAFVGLRPIAAQHSRTEHLALREWARDHRCIVEIGVAEGASAIALREGMDATGTIYLIDPYHLSRISSLNLMKRTARRAVASCPRGKAIWIEEFSSEAARSWRGEIDLLFIDGDHRETAVQRDWDEWSPKVIPDGLVVFHDARLFEGGWTSSDYGPVKLVDRLFRNGNQSAHSWEIVGEVDSLVAVKRRPDAETHADGKAASQ